ncbi:Hypothetical predicted protein [Paramuricea clavata]|uniref:Uncharacterized protein n=1 Tax=Paramuricea clavata TaxID=317549 RepID=A0A6S7JMU2_PARCT|nr:Hypothetical predicted protein [Paramuricea clavata]
MYLLSCVSFLATLFGFLSVASGCTLLGTQSRTFPICLLHNHTHIEIDGLRVPLGTENNIRIQLEEPSRVTEVSCGGHIHSIPWPQLTKDANQVRVRYVEGIATLRVYWCDSFEGPEKAGIRCAIEAFSSACPGRVGVDNHTCVYEVQTDRFSSNTVRKAVQVKTEVAVAVLDKAKVAVGVSHTKENTVVNTYSVESRSYIVIPAGYSFCSFSKVHSVEKRLSTNGFEWKCNLPTFKQTTTISGRCSKLSLCETQTPCQDSHKQLPDSGPENKSAVAQPVAMLLIGVLCMIVSVISSNVGYNE